MTKIVMKLETKFLYMLAKCSTTEISQPSLLFILKQGLTHIQFAVSSLNSLGKS